MKAAIISKKVLGVDCWCPTRFIEQGERCDRVYT